MSTYNVYQLYTSRDIWKNVKAKDKQDAIDRCMGGLPIDETNQEDTETWAEMVDNDCSMCDDEYQCIECEHLEREEKNAV